MLIPLSPAPVQTVTYDTAISSNVQVGPIAEPYRTFTILYSGIYRCVFSLNGQMAADREILMMLSKTVPSGSTTYIATVRISRLGTRNAEFTINRLFAFGAGDVLQVVFRAVDADVNFTVSSMSFSIERIRENTLSPFGF